MANTVKKVMIMLKNLPQMHLGLFQNSNSKTAEATDDLIGHKATGKTTSPKLQSNWDTYSQT